MAGELLQDCLAIDGDDGAFKEKTRIAEVAAATLHKLNTVMKRMKDWQEDRARLKCNIWRLKLALRAAGREADETLRTDPLIETQRVEIARLQTANRALRKEISDIKDALLGEEDITRCDAWKFNDKVLEIKKEFCEERERMRNEILRLKGRLRETEGKREGSILARLRWKLNQFTVADQTVEIVLADMVSKVAETVANLSEELVNLKERLHRSRSKNENLCCELDKLKAMLRSRNGSTLDYRRRINELESLTQELMLEANEYKVALKNQSCTGNRKYINTLGNAERLASDIRNKLRNDHEALLAGGDPDCLQYMKKIIDLRVNFKHLHVEFEKSNMENRVQSRNRYLRNMSTFEDSLKQINFEIDRLKEDYVVKHGQSSGIAGLEYLKKMENLALIVEETEMRIHSLKGESKSNGKEDAERLGDLIQKLCLEIKELEKIVASVDRSSLLERIEQREESIVRLKAELSEKDDQTATLQQKISSSKRQLEERIKEVKDARKKLATLEQEKESLKEKMKKMEGKISGFLHEREVIRKEHEETQQVKRETTVIKEELQNLRFDKESLLREIQRMREDLLKRSEELRITVAARDALEKTSESEISKLKTKLQIVQEENERLQAKIDESIVPVETRPNGGTQNSDKENGDSKLLAELTESANSEAKRLRIELNRSKETLDNANREIVDLKARLDHFSNEKVRLETSIFHLESKKKILVYQLSIEKTNGEERLQELTTLSSEYNSLERKASSLKAENYELRIELTKLKAEKESLKESMENVNSKCIILEDRINRYKLDCNALQKEISKRDAVRKEMEGTKTELNMALDKIKSLESENSSFRDNLEELTLKNTSAEARVQVLLAEKNDLATRINELDEENVVLKDQLNKVKAENEYFSIELDKSRIENDGTKRKNVSLLAELGQMESNIERLRRSNDEQNTRINEMESEYRILDNRLKILQTKNELNRVTLKDENECGKNGSCIQNYQREGNTNQIKVASWIISNVSPPESSDPDRKHAVEEIERNRAKRDDTKFKSSTNKRTFQDDKVKLKGKDERQRLRVENDALKYELTNLRTEKSCIGMELSRAKEEIEKLRIELMKVKAQESTTKPISNKLEIVNLYYRKEVRGYGCLSEDDMETESYNKEGSLTKEKDLVNSKTINVYEEVKANHEPEMKVEELLQVIDNLKVENVALKVEIHTLRRNVIVNFTGVEETRERLRYAVEEIQALKVELTKLRDEKESLGTRLDAARTELDKLKSEKVALKDELIALRKINSDLRDKQDKLQNDYEQLREWNAGLEKCLAVSVKGINKYTLCSASRESLGDQLRNNIERYISCKDFLDFSDTANVLDENSDEITAEYSVENNLVHTGAHGNISKVHLIGIDKQ